MLTVGFDLDLTLVDSRIGIVETMVVCLAEVGLGVDERHLLRQIGRPLDHVIADLAPGRDRLTLTARYRELYPGVGVPRVTLLPGARESLREIHGLGGRVLVVSAKSEPAVWAVLRHVGLDEGALRADVVRGDLFARGKSAVLLSEGAHVYVGDHPGDMDAALGAAALPVGVVTGLHSREELVEAGARVVLGDLGELPPLLRAWTRGGVPVPEPGPSRTGPPRGPAVDRVADRAVDRVADRVADRVIEH